MGTSCAYFIETTKYSRKLLTARWSDTARMLSNDKLQHIITEYCTKIDSIIMQNERPCQRTTRRKQRKKKNSIPGSQSESSPLFCSFIFFIHLTHSNGRTDHNSDDKFTHIKRLLGHGMSLMSMLLWVVVKLTDRTQQLWSSVDFSFTHQSHLSTPLSKMRWMCVIRMGAPVDSW